MRLQPFNHSIVQPSRLRFGQTHSEDPNVGKVFQYKEDTTDFIRIDAFNHNVPTPDYSFTTVRDAQGGEAEPEKAGGGWIKPKFLNSHYKPVT